MQNERSLRPTLYDLIDHIFHRESRRKIRWEAIYIAEYMVLYARDNIY